MLTNQFEWTKALSTREILDEKQEKDFVDGISLQNQNNKKQFIQQINFTFFNSSKQAQAGSLARPKKANRIGQSMHGHGTILNIST